MHDMKNLAIFFLSANELSQKDVKLKARQMAQRLRTLVTLPEGPGLVPRTIHNSSFKGSDALFLTPWKLSMHIVRAHRCI